MPKVAAVKAASYDTQIVEQALSELLAHLGGIKAFIQPGDKVLVKPNMLEAVDEDKAVTTHAEVVRAVLREVKRQGGTAIVGDSPGTAGTLKVAERCGIAAVCREEGVALVPFEDTVELPYPEGVTVKKFVLAQPLAEVDKVISVAKMKTHTFMGVTGATKNLFGLVVGMQKAQFHFRMQERREFASMLVDLGCLVKPVLSIVDGIVGMEGNGPRNGVPKPAGVLLAGDNCFAVDVVMTGMMGFKPERLPLTRLALERGLTPDFSGIDLVGSAKDLQLNFVEPRSLLALNDRIPRWAAAFGRNHLTARPEIDRTCITCGRCVAHCPPQAMKIVDGKACINYERCIRCYCCQELCPADAVHLEEGVWLRLARRFLQV